MHSRLFGILEDRQEKVGQGRADISTPVEYQRSRNASDSLTSDPVGCPRLFVDCAVAWTLKVESAWRFLGLDFHHNLSSIA